MACHEARVRGDGRAVVAGRVRDVHARELTDDRLVLEDRLEDALAHLRLIRRVRGEELASRQHDVRDRRDVVVVDPRAEERELGAGVNVPGCQLLDVAHELRLAERRGQIELAAEAHPGRNLLEELVERRDPDRGEHLLAVGVGQREVAHCWATCARYAAASMSESSSAGSAMRMRMSQPSP